MATNVPTQSKQSTILASIDMGTNSFKLLVVRADSPAKFLVIDRVKEPVELGRETATISESSHSRAIQALQKFNQILQTHKPKYTRLVATSAIRDAANSAQFLQRIRQELGFEVDVLSGDEEARYVYLGVLQFLPVFEKRVLIVDIGGGSTEFVIGKEGEVLYSMSLNLGHIRLTQEFLKEDQKHECGYCGNCMISELGCVSEACAKKHVNLDCEEKSIRKRVTENDENFRTGRVCSSEQCVKSPGIGGTWGSENDGIRISRMRRHIRMVIEESRMIEKVNEVGFEIAIGSSGSIQSIEKASFLGYAQCMRDKIVPFEDFRRHWKFTGGELGSLVQKLCENGEDEKVRRDSFFKRRSEFIVAGAVLLEEIFHMLGIGEMEVSGYALGEGVIAENLPLACDGYYDMKANYKWRSVVCLATRFNSKKRMKGAACCAGIAKKIFEGLGTHYAPMPSKHKFVDAKDIEYLEAACLLHNIGQFFGRKGYHKRSYHIIMNNHLMGYSIGEIKLIALLVRHHKKRFPKFDHASLKDFPKEVKHKFRILGAIIRIAVIIHQYQCINLKEMEFLNSCEGIKLVFSEAKDHLVQPVAEVSLAKEIEAELRQELEHFKMVFPQELVIVFPSRSTQ